MTVPICMTKEDMAKGFAKGATLIQEEWANQQEIIWLDELIAEGVAVETHSWKYVDEFQCERRRVSAPK